MIGFRQKCWPPLITDAELPRLVVWRDRMLTLGLWMLLLVLCPHPFYLLGSAVI